MNKRTFNGENSAAASTNANKLSFDFDCPTMQEHEEAEKANELKYDFDCPTIQEYEAECEREKELKKKAANEVRFNVFVDSNGKRTEVEVVYERDINFFNFDTEKAKEVLRAAKSGNAIQVSKCPRNTNIKISLYNKSVGVFVKYFDEVLVNEDFPISILTDSEAGRIFFRFLKMIKPYMIRKTNVITDVDGVVRVTNFDNVFEAMDFYDDMVKKFKEIGFGVTWEGDWMKIGDNKICLTTEVE